MTGMDFSIVNLTKSRIGKNFLRKVAKKTFDFLKIKKIAELSLVIVGEKQIKDLNKKYRGKNKITDVLSFDYGEIFICLSRAKKQAKKLNHSLKQELATLLIHGILHLAGYDDKTKMGYNKMVKTQNKILSQIMPFKN